MTVKKIDEAQLAQIVGGGCGNPKHGDTDRDHLCTDPEPISDPGGRDAPDAAGGTGDGANTHLGE